MFVKVTWAGLRPVWQPSELNNGNNHPCFSLSASYSDLCFSPKYVSYVFFSTSSSHFCALSALSAASGRGRTEVCAFLLDQGPGLEIPNRRGMVPLLSATKHGHTQVSQSIKLHLYSTFPTNQKVIQSSLQGDS